MKVLFTTHHTAFLRPSGGEIELIRMLSYLRSSGIEADLFDISIKDTKSYDLFFHFGTNLDGYNLMQQCKTNGKPIILFPNVWINNSNIKNLNIIESFFKIANYYIFTSHAEKDNCMKYLSIDSNKIFIVPSIVDDTFFSIKSDLAKTFKNLYGLNDYLLSIASISPDQGQLEIIKAFHDLEFPIVFIGASRDDKYLLKCIESSKNRNLFIPSTSYGSNLILGAIEGCSLYFELKVGPAGLSALEAGAAGKKILLNQNSWTTENFESYVLSFESPYDFDNLKLGIYEVLNSNFNDKENLSKFIADNHNEDYCLSKIIKIINLIS